MPSPASSPMPVPAATIVLIRPSPAGAEVLLTRRPASMAFAADLDVFPGGRVDDADRDERLARVSGRSADEAAAVLGENVSPDDALALHHAAIRELVEEAGVLLADGPAKTVDIEAARDRLLSGIGLGDALAAIPVRFATDRLVPIAQWTTPRFMPRRFATWFFAADLPPDAEPTFRAAEVVSHRWIRPADALDELAAGASRMWVPTTSVLQQLAAIGATNAAGAARSVSFGRVLPPEFVEEGETRIRIAVWAAGAVPGRAATVTLHGRRELVVVDPGDPSEAAVDAVEAAIARREGRLAAIVLTSPDPDHAAGAEALAIPHAAPILVAPGAGRHLPYDTSEVGDGQRLPADVELRVRLGQAGSDVLEVVGP